LYVQTLTQLGAGSWNHRELDHQIEANTGGVRAAPFLTVLPDGASFLSLPNDNM
jgi:hypothetical protein